MKYNYAIKLLIKLSALILISFILSTCEKPERDNPWDALSRLAPGSWAPQNFLSERVGITAVKLTWTYGDHNIEGFKLDRQKGNGEWQTAYKVFGADTREWTDEDIVPEQELTYTYRLYAFAGENKSRKVYGSFWDYESQTLVVEVISLPTGKVWMDRNLGASRPATSSTDAQAYGDLYQWGRAADGHQMRTSGTTSDLSDSDTPGHGNFILAPFDDWRSPQNDNLWQGVNGINNPCPAGYRLPTEAELEAERQSWSSNDAAGAFASSLKLPMAGGRHSSNGSLNGVGSGGAYWSSTLDHGYSQGMLFDIFETHFYIGRMRRAGGYSVRCIKD